MSSYRGFILDADNTLFDFNRAEREALEEALKINGYASCPPESYELYHAINEQLWRLFEQGAVSQDELRTERFRLLLQSLPRSGGRAAEPQKLGQDYIACLSSKGYLLPHAFQVLHCLSSRTSLVLVSNGIPTVQRGRIARSGIGRFFKSVLISGELGISKPDPTIFRLALGLLRLPGDSVLCVGDSPSSDIRGGYQAGLDTCWYAPRTARYPRQEPRPTYRIRDLRQLLDFPIEEG